MGLAPAGSWKQLLARDCGDVAANPVLLLYIVLLVSLKSSISAVASSAVVSQPSPAACCPLVLVLFSFAV